MLLLLNLCCHCREGYVELPRFVDKLFGSNNPNSLGVNVTAAVQGSGRGSGGMDPPPPPPPPSSAPAAAGAGLPMPPTLMVTDENEANDEVPNLDGPTEERGQFPPPNAAVDEPEPDVDIPFSTEPATALPDLKKYRVGDAGLQTLLSYNAPGLRLSIRKEVSPIQLHVMPSQHP